MESRGHPAETLLMQQSQPGLANRQWIRRRPRRRPLLASATLPPHIGLMLAAGRSHTLNPPRVPILVGAIISLAPVTALTSGVQVTHYIQVHECPPEIKPPLPGFHRSHLSRWILIVNVAIAIPKTTGSLTCSTLDLFHKEPSTKRSLDRTKRTSPGGWQSLCIRPFFFKRFGFPLITDTRVLFLQPAVLYIWFCYSSSGSDSSAAALASIALAMSLDASFVSEPILFPANLHDYYMPSTGETSTNERGYKWPLLCSFRAVQAFC